MEFDGPNTNSHKHCLPPLSSSLSSRSHLFPLPRHPSSSLLLFSFFLQILFNSTSRLSDMRQSTFPGLALRVRQRPSYFIPAEVVRWQGCMTGRADANGEHSVRSRAACQIRLSSQRSSLSLPVPLPPPPSPLSVFLSHLQPNRYGDLHRRLSFPQINLFNPFPCHDPAVASRATAKAIFRTSFLLQTKFIHVSPLPLGKHPPLFRSRILAHFFL